MQRFLKLLRHNSFRLFRFFVAGEYGGKNGRPHWHLILFNYVPRETFEWINGNGETMIRAKEEERLWSKVFGGGIITVGEMNNKTAGYVAGYLTEKIFAGKPIESDFELTDPFQKCSLRPAIGNVSRETLEKLAEHPFFYFDGKQQPICSYYLKCIKKEFPIIYQQNFVDKWKDSPYNKIKRDELKLLVTATLRAKQLSFSRPLSYQQQEISPS